MSMSLRSDPELAVVVERARDRADASGELRVQPWSASASRLSPDARQIVTSWLNDGGYERALRAVVADDADLADQ